MKISVTQENLNRGLFAVSHVASKNVTLPILNNVSIDAQGNEIILSATNLEIGIRCSVRGKIEEKGQLTVQSRLLADYISLLPKQTVDLIADESNQAQELEITCKNHHTKIKGQSAEDFPVIPEVEKKQNFVFDTVEFRNAVGQVLMAVSTSETRPEITGVLFSFKPEQLVLAATDSYRLAEKKISYAKGEKGSEARLIVPARTLQEVQRILGGIKDPDEISQMEKISVHVADNQIAFVFGNIELVSRVVEGKYPDYEQIIPEQTNTTIEVAIPELVAATKSASLFARSGIYDVLIKADAEKQQVVVSSTSTQVGENTTVIDTKVTGESNTIVLNYRYLLDGVQNIEGEIVSLKLIDADSPCVLQPRSEQGYLYLIMPIKQ